jgi:FixJ family two-component response regulator/phosphopantetheine adenylyltransferase
MQCIILCVDDDKTILTALRDLLDSTINNCLIEIAESALEAFEICEELAAEGNEPMIVISDFIMPGMRGDELLVRLHKKYPNMIKIMLTGQSELNGVVRVINEANLYRFMDKPFNNDDVVLTTKNAIKERRIQASQDKEINKLKSLLDNSGEGVLSFDSNLIIDPIYSKACEIFFGVVSVGKDAANLLFPDDLRAARLLREIVPESLAVQGIKRELLLSLLPKVFPCRDRVLKASYIPIENEHLMVMLTDITEEQLLAAKVKSEHKRLEMIVKAMTDGRDFFDTVSAFKTFLNTDITAHLSSSENAAEILTTLYREVHTYKGSFSQFSLEHVPAQLHKLESQLDELRRSNLAIKIEIIEQIMGSEALSLALDQDLAILKETLGEDFLEKGGQITLTPEQAAEIKRGVQQIKQDLNIATLSIQVRNLLDIINKIGTVSLKAELESYNGAIQQVAERLEKEVAPLIVTGGDDIMLDPQIYSSFLRSLVHVFRNCVTHGIEDPENRFEIGKDEVGSITCHIDKIEDALQISIADDGAGIRIEALRKKAEEIGIYPEQDISSIPDADIMEIIFMDSMTTATAVNEWAGRGVGLSAVRQEAHALGGTVSIETEYGLYTKLTMVVPLSTK